MSYRPQIVWSCLCTQCKNLFLFSCGLSRFISNVTVGKVGFKFTILLFVFNLSMFFHASLCSFLFPVRLIKYEKNFSLNSFIDFSVFSLGITVGSLYVSLYIKYLEKCSIISMSFVLFLSYVFHLAPSRIMRNIH